MPLLCDLCKIYNATFKIFNTTIYYICIIRVIRVIIWKVNFPSEASNYKVINNANLHMNFYQSYFYFDVVHASN